MSPSRKIGKIGMIAGGSALVLGILAFGLPLLFMLIAFTQIHLMNFDKHPEIIAAPMYAWVLGGPIGMLLILFGTPTFLISGIFYLGGRGEERRDEGR